MNRFGWLFFPLATIYGTAVFIRNRLYDAGWLKSETPAIFTVSIGNLSAGGSGKTPHTAWLAGHFKDAGPAILSRGYGRATTGFVRYKPGMTSADVGDEPLEQARRFPAIPVAVSEDRLEGIAQLMDSPTPPGVVLLDDAFQHRQVKPHLQLLLTPFYRPFYNDHMLPAGNLRDNRREAGRADAIVVTKTPAEWPQQEMNRIRNTLKQYARPVFFSTIEYRGLRAFDGSCATPNDFRETPFVLVTALADSSPLVHYLQEVKPGFPHLNYRDHHRFQPRDIHRIEQIIGTFAPRKAHVITTAKDAVKLEGLLHLLLQPAKIDKGRIWIMDIGIKFYEEQKFRSFIDYRYYQG